MRFGINLIPSWRKEKDEEKAEQKIENLKIENQEPELPIIDGDSLSFALSTNIEYSTVKDLIRLYRDLEMNHEVELAIDEIVNDAVVIDDEQPLELILDDVEISDNVKSKIKEEFDNVMTLLDFNKKGNELFRQWYVDGRIYLYKIIDQKSLKKGIQAYEILNPMNITRFKDKDSGKTFFLYKNDIQHSNGLQYKEEQGWLIPEESIVFVSSGLLDRNKDVYISYLHKAIKPLNQLKLLEDSSIIYRFTRAPERRVFNIDVGRLPKNKAEEYIQKMISRFKSKLSFNVVTGEVSQRSDAMTMTEDFYFARTADGKGTTVETLQGGQSIAQMDDIEYFKKKLYKSLTVPTSRMSTEDRSMLSFDRLGEITHEELRFAKFITKLRNQFIQLIVDLIKTQLLLKNVINTNDWNDVFKNNIYFRWNSDNHYSEAKEQEILSSKLQILRDMNEYKGTYFSKEYIMKHLLLFNDEDIKAMKKQMDKEKKEEPQDEEDGSGWR